ncbi:MAG: aminopeptidase [Christensenellaceae bacterium]|jgi:leucyl aminopeptidase (aminopeptidase T)|nr:aminopeptidase [Christensenellaceae bacterium]
MYQYELVSAALKLLRDMFKVQKGESVVITADTESHMSVVDATAQAAYALGAKPLVMLVAAPRGVGKAADADLPLAPLTAALKEADVWIEYNNEWLLYSTPFDDAVAYNKKLRYMCLVGMNPDLMLRNIGRVNNIALGKFLQKAEEITKNAKTMRITTPAGCDLTFENQPGRDFYTADGFVGPGEVRMMAGQISWAPKLESINGTLVFDGSMVPPSGLLKSKIVCTVEKGVITKIEGGADARALQDYLAGFNHERMFKLAHVSYGFNPGAKLTGDIVEDERVWGSTEWGIGNVGPMLTSDIPGGIPAPSHTDGICMSSTVWLDGELFVKDGEVVGPTPEVVELARIAKQLEY